MSGVMEQYSRQDPSSEAIHAFNSVVNSFATAELATLKPFVLVYPVITEPAAQHGKPNPSPKIWITISGLALRLGRLIWHSDAITLSVLYSITQADR